MTGKLITLVTASVSSLRGTISDVALLAMHEAIIRQATTASNVFHGKALCVRKLTFAGDFSLVNVK
jgi:hypothetical protein